MIEQIRLELKSQGVVDLPAFCRAHGYKLTSAYSTIRALRSQLPLGPMEKGVVHVIPEGDPEPKRPAKPARASGDIPGLGARLKVTGLVLLPGHRVGMQLSNGTASWMVTVQKTPTWLENPE